MLACPWLAPAGTGYRDDRVSLNGTWRFQLRRDNRLLAAAPVRFGPVTASSQAAFLDPASGMETSAGRWFTSTPVPVAATILAAEAGSNWSRQVWRPHPQQRGPAWWQLDMGAARSLRAVAGIRTNWVKPANVVVRADISPDGARWTNWGTASADGNSPETWIRADPARARVVRLHFAPAQFPGAGLIEVFLRGSDGLFTPWLPLPQRT